MISSSEVAKKLKQIGADLIIGVPGSGDSFEIINSFLESGGNFLGTSTELVAPIIASTINRASDQQRYSVSISIRGPGLIASLPGLYFNYIEDLKSISISEDLNISEVTLNHHKPLDTSRVLGSIGLIKSQKDDFHENFSIDNKKSQVRRMIHFSTRSDKVFTYSRSPKELCHENLKTLEFIRHRKILVIGKIGIENSEVKRLLQSGFPFFLTPGALPYYDLNSMNFLGVWSGTEQFKYLSSDPKILENVVIIRVGVMKRELLTMRQKVPHIDLSLASKTEVNQLLDLIGPVYEYSKSLAPSNLRKSIIHSSSNWSVSCVISILNELNLKVNYSFDVGSFGTLIENFIRPSAPNSLYSSFIGKFMGTAVPIAIGLGIAKPNTPIICILGEGGFASSFNEISLISTLNLPICLLILSDNSMHSVVNNRTIDQSVKNKFFPANFQKLKTATPPDVPCINVNTSSKFTDAISNWDMKSPKLIFLEFDPSSYATGVEFLR